jgi:hypothetical protein
LRRRPLHAGPAGPEAAGGRHPADRPAGPGHRRGRGRGSRINRGPGRRGGSAGAKTRHPTALPGPDLPDRRERAVQVTGAELLRHAEPQNVGRRGGPGPVDGAGGLQQPLVRADLEGPAGPRRLRLLPGAGRRGPNPGLSETYLPEVLAADRDAVRAYPAVAALLIQGQQGGGSHAPGLLELRRPDGHVPWGRAAGSPGPAAGPGGVPAGACPAIRGAPL